MTGSAEVAVVAHRRKELDGGLDGLRRLLAARGIEPLWYEIGKSRKATRRVGEAVDEGADLVFAWGGDGTVQHCLDALAGTDVALAILPAGTANSVAGGLGVPDDLRGAVEVGLDGTRRRIDLMAVNGERSALMVSAGFSAEMIAATGKRRKRRLGRLAYLWSALRERRADPRAAAVVVDGGLWYAGPATSVLVRKMPRILGVLDVSPDASPDDGRLHITVLTAAGTWQWLRVLARLVGGDIGASPFCHVTTGQHADVRFDRPTLYELDGGERSAVERLEVVVEPGALTVCVPP